MDARRAMVRYHFAQCIDYVAAFERLRSVQFDPIAPIGCNHDLVLHARLNDYHIGHWERFAYEDRFVYDGWDKQASLVPYSGYAVRRIFHDHYLAQEPRIFKEYSYAIEAVLSELRERGPLLPKELTFQERKDDWKGSWHGPNLSKHTLRSLWHTGMVMTTGRRNGHHVYDLTERVVPASILATPKLSEDDAAKELVLERHRAMGIVRPSAPYEIWSYGVLRGHKHRANAELVATRELVPIDVEGMKAHATPDLLAQLDMPSLSSRVVFIAPLDPFLWDRKMTSMLFDFDYVWEIYMKEEKRKWGYYVLPVLWDNALVGRIEFWCRDKVLTIKNWYEECDTLEGKFWDAFQVALSDLMRYANANEIVFDAKIDSSVREKMVGGIGFEPTTPSV